MNKQRLLAAVLNAGVNVSKPYKPRKIKTDPYHKMLRDARKRRPKDGTRDANAKRTRKKWEQRNKPALEKRSKYVRDQRKLLGLDKAETIQDDTIMKTNQTAALPKPSVTADSVSSSSPRFLDDIRKVLDQIQDDTTAIDQALKTQQKILANMSMRIDQQQFLDSPQAMDPEKLKVTVEDMENLKKNYGLVKSLYDTLSTLNATSAKLKLAFAEDSKESERVMGEIARIRKGVVDKLDAAFSFLQDLAKSKAPEAMTSFIKKVNKVVERSVSYADSASYLHMFVSEDGILTFSHYLHLKRAVDENGDHFPDLYIVLSMKASAPPQFYLHTMTDFEPPSDALLTEQVETIKEVVRSLHTMLAMDSFDNSIGSIPIPLLEKDKINVDQFSAAGHISKVEVYDDTGAMAFTLKPNVVDRDTITQITEQLYGDVRGLMKTTKGKIKMNVRDIGDSKVIVVSLQRPNNAPAATPDDLMFLRTRFGLAEGQVNGILRIVNASTTSAVASTEQALTIPATGNQVNAKQVLEAINQCVLAAGKRDYIVPLLDMLKDRFEVDGFEAMDFAECAIKEACMFRGDLSEYVRQLRQRATATTENAASAKAPAKKVGKADASTDAIWHKAWSEMAKEMKGMPEPDQATLVDYLISYAQHEPFFKNAYPDAAKAAKDARSFVAHPPFTPEWSVTGGIENASTLVQSLPAAKIIKDLQTAAPGDEPFDYNKWAGPRVVPVGRKKAFLSLDRFGQQFTFNAGPGNPAQKAKHEALMTDGWQTYKMYQLLGQEGDKFVTGLLIVMVKGALKVMVRGDGGVTQISSKDYVPTLDDFKKFGSYKVQAGVQTARPITEEELLAAAERARILQDNEYHWRMYVGPDKSLTFRGKTYVVLHKGDVLGFRLSSNGSQKRMVVKDLGLTRVFTLTPDQEAFFSKNVKVCSPKITASN